MKKKNSMKKLNLKMVAGCSLICMFCCYTEEVSITENELTFCRVLCGQRLSDVVAIASDKIKVIQPAFGRPPNTMVRVMLRNGGSYDVAHLWHPAYDVIDICNTLNLALNREHVVLRIFPLWWALWCGLVLIGLGVADYFGLIKVISKNDPSKWFGLWMLIYWSAYVQ